MKMRANVDKDPVTGCWEWNKYRLATGYGRTRYMGRNFLAHRLAWILAHPDDLIQIADKPKILVCHHCDNPPCCNPDHLFIGNHQKNCHDMRAKGRMNIKPAQAAARFQRVRKFTHEQIDAIRSAQGLIADVAKQFGCSAPYVSMLRRGVRKTAPRAVMLTTVQSDV